MGHVLMARPVHPRRGDGGIGRHASLRNWFARVKVRVLFALPHKALIVKWHNRPLVRVRPEFDSR